MPTYSFKNKKNGKCFDRVLKISELDAFLKNNPNLVQEITSAPAIGDSVRLGIKRPDEGFKDLLRNIKKRSGGLNSRYV